MNAMEPPSNIKLTANGHTTVNVAWTAASESDKMDMYAAYIAGSVKKQCTAKEGATCTIDGLILRVPYKMCVRACHAHSRTATTVPSSFADAQLVSSGDLLEFVANSVTGDYTCSDAVCGSANIPMQAPSNIQLAFVNHTVVKVTWTAPGVKKAMDVVAAYVAGSVEKNCTAKEGAECTIDGLLLRIPYTVCVRACHSHAVKTKTPSFTFADALVEFVTESETGDYACSNAVSGRATIDMQAPSNIKLTADGHTKVNVAWMAASDKDNMDVYAAYVAGNKEKYCKSKGDAKCTITGLLPRIPYTVCVRACHPHSATATAVPSTFAGAQLVSSGDLLEFVANSETGDYTCSKAVCDSVTITMQGEKYWFIILHRKHVW
uniref:Fibronectin type-III domain-containing protein n=1 Tax=Echinococcus canadensis TaxID=519352 RepID=A0A915EW96_9CEST